MIFWASQSVLCTSQQFAPSPFENSASENSARKVVKKMENARNGCKAHDKYGRFNAVLGNPSIVFQTVSLAYLVFYSTPVTPWPLTPPQPIPHPRRPHASVC